MKRVKLHDRLPDILGLVLIALLSAFCFGCFRDGVKIFEYASLGIHPAVARALYNGQTFLSDRPDLGIPHDFQFHNGALYTHWGYGVALLQLPFHLLATLFSDSSFAYFPDRTIFLMYLLLGTSVFWASLRTLVESLFELEPMDAALLSTAAAMFFGVESLYWLTSMGGYVYELTIAYFTVTQLIGIALFIFFFFGRSERFIWLLGIAEGLGLLIRPTGALYCAAFLALLVVGAEEKRKAALKYLLPLFPFVLLWMFFNHSQTGNLLGANLSTVFSEPSEMHAFQFGDSPCFGGFSSSLTLFLYDLAQAFVPWKLSGLQAYAQSCGGIPSAEISHQTIPLVSPAVTLLLLGVLLTELRNLRLLILLPVALILTAFALYVSAGLRFGARYMGDIWPALILILLIPVFSSEELGSIGKKAARALSGVLVMISLIKIGTDVVPQLPEIAATDSETSAYNPPLNLSREKISTSLPDVRKWAWGYLPYESSFVSHVPNFKQCPPYRAPNFEMDALWWEDDCRTWAITTVFLSFPEKAGNDFVLKLNYQLQGDPGHGRQIEVTINGDRYSAPFNSGYSEIPFRLQKERFHSNVVPVVIRWSRSYAYSDVLLKRVSIE